MNISENIRDYEILIRINQDGSIGAHCIKISEIFRDGDVISASLLPPEPLSRMVQEGPESLSERLGSVLTAALLENERLTESLRCAKAEAAELSAKP